MAIAVAVVGAGARGRAWLAELQRDDAFTVAAVVDTDPAALASAGHDAGVPRRLLFPTLHDAFAGVKCDAVIVATPADAHEAPCHQALAHSAALLVEKPFTLTYAPAESIVRKAEAAGIPVVVGQNYRAMRAWRTARSVVAAGTLGPLRSIVCNYYRVPHPMAPSLAGMEDHVLWGMGIHHIDALRHVLASRIRGVFAQSFSSRGSGSRRGASLQALLQFEDEVRCTYGATYESSGHEFFERGQEFYARIVGARATLHIFNRWLFVCEGRRLPRPIRRGPRTTTEESLLLRQLERAMLHGEEPECSGRDNLETIAAADAIVRSSRERRWVDLEEVR